jgi:hypothetical protein
MRAEMYCKFRADLLGWCDMFRKLEGDELAWVGRRSIHKQMRRLRKAYYRGGVY